MSNAKVGQSIANLVADAVVKVRTGLIRHEHDALARHQTARMETMERELAPLVADLYKGIIDNPDMPDMVKSLLRPAAGPEHPVDFIILAFAILGIAFSVPGAAASNFAQNAKNVAFDSEPNVPLEAPSAAQAEARGMLGGIDGRHDASKGGTDPQRYDVMLRLAELQADLGTVLEAKRRGVIDDGEVHARLQRLGYSAATIDLVGKLVYGPPSPALAIQAQVEGHMSADEAASVVAQGGIDPKWAGVMYETAGEPPGIHEMLELLNRGIIDEATVRQAITEARYKNKYIDAIIAMRRHLIPLRSVTGMVHHGAWTAPQAVDNLMKLGYAQEDAQALIDAATTAKTAVTRELAQTTVMALYERQSIARDEATTRLRNLKYDDTEIGLLIDQADFMRGERLRAAAIGRLRSRFVARHLTDAQVSAAMDKLGVPHAERDAELAVWAVERDSTTLELSPSVLVAAYRRGALTLDVTTARLVGLGMSTADADLFIKAHMPLAKGQ